MDRGRVGTLAIGNKTIRDQMIAHQQSVHLERINKIKNRKPGSSNTLDNTAPVIVKAALVNPRKIAKKKEFNEMTDRENRVLLKRISNTLTGPPKITTADYDRMRKIVVNLKGGKARYEEAVRARHHKIYLDHLKKMGPYYDPKEWELDYKRQKVQQMFMREVLYERPKDYVVKAGPRFITLGTIHDKDDFKPHHTQLGIVHSLPVTNGSRKSKGGGASQVNRVRSLASMNGTGSSDGDDNMDANGSNNSGRLGLGHFQHRQSVNNSNSKGGLTDEDAGRGQQLGEVLACTHRYIKVLYEDTPSDGDNNNNSGSSPEQEGIGAMDKRWGEVVCYAVEEALVISGTITEEDGRPGYAAEAEIDICGLADIRGIDSDLVMSDKDELRALAKYVSERVDLRIADGGIARITLNLADEGSGMEGEGAGSVGGRGNGGGSPGGGNRNGAVSSSSSHNGAGEGQEDGPKQYENDWLSKQNESSVEFENSFIGEDVFTSSYENIEATVVLVGVAKAKLQKLHKPEQVQISAEVACEVDQITVQVVVTSNSDMQFKGRPAVPAGAKFTFQALLPSIMSADVYLMKEYFHNLVQNLVIETNYASGSNKIHLAE